MNFLNQKVGSHHATAGNASVSALCTNISSNACPSGCDAQRGPAPVPLRFDRVPRFPSLITVQPSQLPSGSTDTQALRSLPASPPAGKLSPPLLPWLSPLNPGGGPGPATPSARLIRLCLPHQALPFHVVHFIMVCLYPFPPYLLLSVTSSILETPSGLAPYP